MADITKACSVENNILNTGKECDTAMVATAMLIAVHPDVEFDDDDLEDPIVWMQDLIQKKLAFPIFGNKAPVRTINNNQQADIIVELDDGTQVFLRYGIYNRVFETTSGGLCYARSLQSLLNSGYSILEIDQVGQMLAKKKANGKYAALSASYMYAPAPVLADFKTTPYKNRFQYSMSPTELVNNGIIFKGAVSFLDLMGLIDVELTEGAASSTTKIKLNVKTECAGANLLTKFPADIPDATNFIITNEVTGAEVTPSAVAIVAGFLEFTGTFVSATKYRVNGTSPEVWATNNIIGYDGKSLGGVVVTIP